MQRFPPRLRDPGAVRGLGPRPLQSAPVPAKDEGKPAVESADIAANASDQNVAASTAVRLAASVSGSPRKWRPNAVTAAAENQDYEELELLVSLPPRLHWPAPDARVYHRYRWHPRAFPPLRQTRSSRSRTRPAILRVSRSLPSKSWSRRGLNESKAFIPRQGVGDQQDDRQRRVKAARRESLPASSALSRHLSGFHFHGRSPTRYGGRCPRERMRPAP